MLPNFYLRSSFAFEKTQKTEMSKREAKQFIRENLKYLMKIRQASHLGWK